MLVVGREPDAEAFTLDGDTFFEDDVEGVELDLGVELFLELVDDGGTEHGFGALEEDVGGDAEGCEDYEDGYGDPEEPAFPFSTWAAFAAW